MSVKNSKRTAPKGAKPAGASKGKMVVVRAYSAGVYYGCLEQVSRDKKTVTLSAARNIHSWTGALSTLDIAAKGVSTARMSAPVRELGVTDVCTISLCSPEASRNLDAIAPWQR